MITIHASAYQTHLHLVFEYPGKKKREVTLPGTDTDKLVQQARRMMYFENREYIILKLGKWLNQRLHAFEVTNREALRRDAAQLIIMIDYYSQSAFPRVVARVAESRSQFEAIALGASSGHYQFYMREIKPILDFCEKMKGTAV